MTYANICESVQQLIKRYNETDPFRLCKAMGVILLFQPMGTHQTAIKGFFMKCKRIRSITVNSDLPEVIQRIIVAHELGHAMLHQDGGIHAFHEVALFDQTSDMEREANLFASELLLDDGVVLDTLQQDTTFFNTAAQLMVPAEILEFKLRLMKWKGHKTPDSPIQSNSNFLCKLDVPENADYFS